MKRIKHPDVIASSHGSIALLYLESEKAKQWIAENAITEPWQFGMGGGTLSVDNRYALEIMDAMEADGLMTGFRSESLT